ncbi:MAG: CBS domain-containing protein [Thermoplasmata archaeon]|nr:CBS domain-containing protein [Thermoplasmata archaeon]
MLIYAQQLMTNDFAVIDYNEDIAKAISLFEEEETDTLVVMDGKEYKGILTQKDIVRAKIPPEAKVKNFVKHAPRVEPSSLVQEVARLMLESDIYHLPVFENSKLVGMIRDDDILRRVIEEEFGNEKIEKFMTKEPITVTPDESIGKVIRIFKERNISRLPVVENGKLVGIITVRDIMEKVVHPEDKPEYGEFIAEKKSYLKIPVKGIMADEPITMPPNATVKEVVEEMLKNGFGGMLICEDDKLVGIVTKKDLLEPIASYAREEKIFAQLAGELHKIEGFDRDEAMTYINEFIRKHEEFLENGHLYCYLKQHKERKHGLPLVYCKIRLSSPKGFFVADDDGWGFRQAMKKAILAIEKQIERIKERKK